LFVCCRNHVIEFRPGGDLALQQGDVHMNDGESQDYGNCKL